MWIKLLCPRGDEWLVSLEQDQINHDYLLFRVFDNYGLYSVSAVFKLNINTSITSVSTEIWGHEGVDIPISVSIRVAAVSR